MAEDPNGPAHGTPGPAPSPAGRRVPRRRASVDALIRAVLDSPGDTTRAERAAAFGGDTPAGSAWARYAADVRSASFRIGDGDVARLRAAGMTEDAILETTLAAAVGAAAAVLDAGLQGLAAERS